MEETRISFDGVLGETDQMGFLQKAGSEICLEFDDHVFDSVALKSRGSRAAPKVTQEKSTQNGN